MSLTPQDNARTAYSQTNPTRHIFQGQASLPTPSPSQPRNAYPRPTQVGIRQQVQQVQQHQSPYSTPYATPQALPPRQNGSNGVSAEQQIAQGILSNGSVGNGTSTPQRRAPPLGTTIHVPSPHGAPQNGSMSVSHAVNPTSGMNQSRDFSKQIQSQTGSPALQSLAALQNLAAGRPSMNGSPTSSNLGSRPQDASPVSPQDVSPVSPQDLSMIDPQLAIDQQLTDPNNAMLAPQSNDAGSPPEVVQGEMLSPPPGGSYPTFDALFAAAQAHALAHGYAFVIGRSKRDNRGLKKVFLICDRGGTNKEKVPGEQRQRKTKSRKCGCEFGVFGMENKTSWLLRGRMDGAHLSHNHPPSESPTEHPGARKLDPKAIAAVKALEESGVSVKETLEILHRENPTVRFLPRDIYNARAAIKRDPSRVEANAMESLPSFYKKPALSFEEKLRAELRTEVANANAEVEKVRAEWKKEVEDLQEQLRQKAKMISKFEMFIDICNERVMVQRERLAENEGGANASASA
ncbi:hypothetical protein B7494_g4135 [Chlorociboria aeruginascens]|nr:hypothetical protein B7494_g4135 [Chlorociboria aeruginascens]